MLIHCLAMKRGSDFDKYEALQLAEELVRCASNAHHEKFTYHSVALQEIRRRLHKPEGQFKAFFLVFFLRPPLWEGFAVPGQGWQELA